MPANVLVLDAAAVGERRQHPELHARGPSRSRASVSMRHAEDRGRSRSAGAARAARSRRPRATTAACSLSSAATSLGRQVREVALGGERPGAPGRRGARAAAIRTPASGRAARRRCARRGRRPRAGLGQDRAPRRDVVSCRPSMRTVAVDHDGVDVGTRGRSRRSSTTGLSVGHPVRPVGPDDDEVGALARLDRAVMVVEP